MSTIVYIVDDDAAFAEVVEIYFNSSQGFRAISFTSPFAALSRLISIPPDVLILDVMMPGMHGDELAEQARDAGCHCPVIILTGLITPEESQRKHYRIGNRIVVGKPVPLGVLKALVQQSVGRNPANMM